MQFRAATRTLLPFLLLLLGLRIPEPEGDRNRHPHTYGLPLEASRYESRGGHRIKHRLLEYPVRALLEEARPDDPGGIDVGSDLHLPLDIVPRRLFRILQFTVQLRLIEGRLLVDLDKFVARR